MCVFLLFNFVSLTNNVVYKCFCKRCVAVRGTLRPMVPVNVQSAKLASIRQQGIRHVHSVL